MLVEKLIFICFREVAPSCTGKSDLLTLVGDNYQFTGLFDFRAVAIAAVTHMYVNRNFAGFFQLMLTGAELGAYGEQVVAVGEVGGDQEREFRRVVFRNHVFIEFHYGFCRGVGCPYMGIVYDDS